MSDNKTQIETEKNEESAHANRPFLEQSQQFTNDTLFNTVDAANNEVSLQQAQEFESKQEFTASDNTQDESDSLVSEQQLEQIFRPKKKATWLKTTLVASFAGLVAWQGVSSFLTSLQNSDWLTLGWTSFCLALAMMGLGSLTKELWTLVKLRRHFDVQEKTQQLMLGNSIGQAQSLCTELAKKAQISEVSPSLDRWKNSINSAHSDSEVLELYDALVVAQQDKKALDIVTKLSSQSALMVAVSPLAIADMLLVAWRSFRMLQELAQVYGVELGYWSRIKLLKLVLMNMALAGGSELAIDAGMDFLSLDIAGKVSARAAQGVGVGILTARLGIKAMALLRPLPWKKDRGAKLSSIRKQILSQLKLTSKK